MITKQNLLNLLSLSSCPQLGPSSIKLLEKHFLNLYDVFTAKKLELLQAGLRPGVVNKFCDWRLNFSEQTLLSTLEKEQISFISWHDPDYPLLLKEIPDPPPIIFYRGDLSNNLLNQEKQFLAVIGARQCTSYADKVIKNILPPNLLKQIIIISGLASGVDRLAHQQALGGGAKTVAVLGSGLSWKQFYPRSNRQLAEEIIKSGGCLLSEFPPDTPPNKINFPRRNRLISGLSHGVLVIEAAVKSGSLITARLALEQGREVLAVPGNIFWEKSTGTNQLIQAGAKPILTANDLAESLNLQIEVKTEKILTTGRANFDLLSANEKLIYFLILSRYQCGEKINLEKIATASELDTSTINSTLTILEIKGLIKELSGNFEPC